MSTEKDIRQFIHYYLGCKVRYKDGTALRLKSVSLNSCRIGGFDDDVHFNVPIENFKLCLSRLEDITEEDAIELVKLNKWKQYGNHPHDRVYTTYKNSFGQIVVSWGEGLREKNVPASKEVFSPEEFNFLIKKGYWLFGSDWFDEGIIIDKKTLKDGKA